MRVPVGLVEHLADRAGLGRCEATVGLGTAGGGASELEVGVDRRVVDVGGSQSVDVGADRGDVTAYDGPGEGSVAVGEHVVEGCGQQRPEHGSGIGGTGRAEQVHRLRDERDEVVGAVGEGCVIEHAVGLGDPHRGAAEGGDELLGERAVGRTGGQAEDRLAVEVDRGAGESHGGVERDGTCAETGQRGQRVEAVAAAGVQDVLAAAHGTRGGELLGDRDEVVVRHGEHEDVAGRGELDRREHVDAGQQRGDAELRGLGPTGDAHEGITGGAES